MKVHMYSTPVVEWNKKRKERKDNPYHVHVAVALCIIIYVSYLLPNIHMYMYMYIYNITCLLCMYIVCILYVTHTPLVNTADSQEGASSVWPQEELGATFSAGFWRWRCFPRGPRCSVPSEHGQEEEHSELHTLSLIWDRDSCELIFCMYNYISVCVMHRYMCMYMYM